MPTEPAKPPAPPPVTPTEDEWRALSPEAREAFIDRVNASLSDIALLMTEGRRHKQAKTRLADALGLYFRSVGRTVYLAEEMAVMYPGEPGFSPDVLAIVEVAEPEDDPRMAWVVADEGRGIDVAIEVLHAGDRKKDLVENVERFARLGIPEYFVYDRRDDRVVGYRLQAPGARRYQRIVPQAGRVRSAVLDVDLAVEGGRLRVFHGTSELYGSGELIGRLSGMLESVEAKADAAQAEAEREKAAGERERAAAEREKGRADEAVEGLRQTLLAALAARGIDPSSEASVRIASATDPRELHGWVVRALRASALSDVFG